MAEEHTEKKNLNALIIHPALEPGVIDNAMLIKCILEYGPTEEAGRLFAEEGVHLDEAHTVRIEFQNILRIDHLWMLTSLTKLTLAHNLIEKIENLELLRGLNELDLSFNKIEKIENLEMLTNLEVFTIFHNKIRKLENMETLEKLLVFSCGDNLIEDFKENRHENANTFRKDYDNDETQCENEEETMNYIFEQNSQSYSDDGTFKPQKKFKDSGTCTEIADQKIDQASYLRRFRFLRSVSFKGNPCCDDPMAYLFLKSALTRVTYLDYKTITEEEREMGQSVFRGLLRKLDEIDEKTEKERVAKEEYDARTEFYALSFVEYLSGPEMLEDMFAKDVDGSLLLQVGGELLTFFDQYKEQYVETMATLVEFAQTAYNDRQREIKLFKDLVVNALADSVQKSKDMIADFEVKKEPLVKQMEEYIQKFTAKQQTIEQLEPLIMDLTDSFNELLHEVWKNLMNTEMELFERCEESRVQFSVNMTEKISKLLEAARNAFGAWREMEGAWSMRQFDSLSKLLGNKVMLGDAPPELFEVMMDRDLMMNLVAQSCDNHMRYIDARDDRLLTRTNDWKDDLVQGTTDNEIKRNRDRIMEINFFVDNQREAWTDMQMGLAEAVDPETAALLGDDF